MGQGLCFLHAMHPPSTSQLRAPPTPHPTHTRAPSARVPRGNTVAEVVEHVIRPATAQVGGWVGWVGG